MNTYKYGQPWWPIHLFYIKAGGKLFIDGNISLVKRKSHDIRRFSPLTNWEFLL